MFCVPLTYICFAGYRLVNSSAMFKNTIKIVATVEKGYVYVVIQFNPLFK